MKKSIFLLLVLLLTGCATFQVSTLNHNPVRVVDNEFELQRLLRTDFNFRFDYAQYALRQPRSFDWNNRILGNRYNRYNPYYGYSPYWSRTEMWNDWLWGFNGWNSWGSPHRWSPYGYDRWGYGIYYGWNNHGWNYNYYGWNNWNTWNSHLNPNWGRSYVNGRRSNTRITPNRRVVNSNRVVTTPRTRTVVKNKPIIRTKPIRNYKPIPSVRPNNSNLRPIRTVRVVSPRLNSNTIKRSNSKRKN